MGPLLSWGRAQGVEILYLKLSILGEKGYPDRMILWPDNNIIFVEWKQPGEFPRKLQLARHETLRAMGFDVRVYDDRNVALEEIKSTISATL